MESRMSQMFSPSLQDGNNTSHSMDVTNSVVSSYLHSLRPVDLSEIPLLELLHTLFKNTAVVTADALDQYIDVAKRVTGYYRDAAGTLVVRHEAFRDRLTLLWPVARPVDNPTEATVVRGGGDGVFVETSGAVVPLAAAAQAPARSTCTWHWSMP
jgi:hypothetical protein